MSQIRTREENRFALNPLALALVIASTPRAGTGRLPYKNDVLLLGGLNISNGMAEPGAGTSATPSASLLATNALANADITAMADKGLTSARTGSPPNADGMDVTGKITAIGATAKVGISEPGAKLDD